MGPNCSSGISFCISEPREHQSGFPLVRDSMLVLDSQMLYRAHCIHMKIGGHVDAKTRDVQTVGNQKTPEHGHICEVIQVARP
jgi:hypothetical protein